MTGITSKGIEIDRDFTASPAAVFAAWTKAENFAQWFGGNAVEVPGGRLNYEAVAGGTWSASMVLPDGNIIDWVGDFVELTPNTRFVFTMSDNPALPERATVTVDFDVIETGTRMRMTQETPGFSSQQREATLAGWQTFIDVIGAICETA